MSYIFRKCMRIELLWVAPVMRHSSVVQAFCPTASNSGRQESPRELHQDLMQTSEGTPGSPWCLTPPPQALLLGLIRLVWKCMERCLLRGVHGVLHMMEYDVMWAPAAM